MRFIESIAPIALFAILVQPLAAARAADEDTLPVIGDVPNGTRLYRTHCTVCHGFDGSGKGPARPTLKTPPADHRDGSLMNARDNSMLFDIIQMGCKSRGCSPTMPAFGDDADDLSTWDLVAYLRTLHMPLTAFFPRVDQYLVKQYHLAHEGGERFQAGQRERIKRRASKIDPARLKQTVFTLFRSEQRRISPELVPQQPRRLAELKKPNKLGYVQFMVLEGPRKRKIPVGLALDTNFTIHKLLVTLRDPGLASEYNRRLEKYVGMGKRGDEPNFNTGRDRISRKFDREVQKLYVLAVEGANAYEREERERSWADGTF